MCEELTMTLGQDLSCYAVVKIPASTDLSPENLMRIASEESGNVEYEEDWSTCCSLRILEIKDESGNYLVQDLAVEPMPFDAGQELKLFLSERIDMGQLVESASRYGLIPPVAMSRMVGHVSLPSGDIEHTFQVRKGASQAEKDLAFFNALCQIAKVHYSEVIDE